jgi:hypothetical protein
MHENRVLRITLVPKEGLRSMTPPSPPPKLPTKQFVRYVITRWNHCIISSHLFALPPVYLLRSTSRKHCFNSSTYCILYRAKQVVVGGFQIWTVSGIGKNSLSHFCDCLTCAQAGLRPGIVVKEKDVFHVSVRMNSTGALSQLFKVSLCRSWCAPKSKGEIFQYWYTACYSTSAKVC